MEYAMVDYSNLKSISKIKNKEIRQFAGDASKFILAHKWCCDIKNGYLSFAIPGVIGVFLFEIIPNEPRVDEWLWVITGDLPPAYLVTDDADNWQEALSCYVYEMRKWVQAVINGESLDDVIPVNAQPSIENARMLENRLIIIENDMINVPPNSIEQEW